MSRYVSTPGQCYARQTSEGTFFLAGKVSYVFVFLGEKNVPVDTALGNFISSQKGTINQAKAHAQATGGCLEADVRRNERKMGGFASWEIFRTGFEILIFLRFSRDVQVSKFWIFPRFPAFCRGPKKSQNADFSAVSWDFEGRACPKILRGFPAMNRAQNLDFPAVSRDF